MPVTFIERLTTTNIPEKNVTNKNIKPRLADVNGFLTRVIKENLAINKTGPL
jgi:hypothetical protein